MSPTPPPQPEIHAQAAHDSAPLSLARLDARVPAPAQAALTLFFGAALGYIEQAVETGGIPPQANWGHVALTAAGVGLAALLHRYLSVPAASPLGYARRLVGRVLKRG